MLAIRPISCRPSYIYLGLADFIKGVTYKETDDPLLKQIYEKEGDAEEDAAEKNWKPVDPRKELFAAIRNRKKDAAVEVVAQHSTVEVVARPPQDV